MKSLIDYIVGLILIVFATIPIFMPPIVAQGEYFTWIFAITGFLGFYMLFLNINPFIKCIPAVALINSFYSSAPLVSFIAYFQLLFCCYFYFLCTKIRDHSVVLKMLQCLLFFNLYMYFMQLIGHDPLYNFDRAFFAERFYYGTVGQHMQSASFSVILAAVLIGCSPLNLLFPFSVSMLCNSAAGFLSAGVGLLTYIFPRWNMKVFVEILILITLMFTAWMVIGGKFQENISLKGGRLGVWLSTFNLSMKHWFIGHGIGTYKVLFPAIGGIRTVPWMTTHNCWLQIFFETGIVGLAGFVGYFIYLVSNLCKLIGRAIFKDKAIACLAGLTMIATNMVFHFPTRMVQSVLIIIFFLAYCQKVVNYGKR